MQNPRELQLSIRLARVEDCEVLTALMLRSSAYRGRYRSMIVNYPVTEEMVRAKEVWAAERDGVIVGFYRLDVANADLDLMFVSDEAQGSGVGRKLFEHMKALAAAQGLSAVRIVAHPPAADFYRRMGALHVGVNRAANDRGWDRPLMTLPVSA